MGSGFKTFTGTTLAVADVQDYLMDQAVMSFADSTARSSAVGSPEEGMITVLRGTDVISAYNGSAHVDIACYSKQTLSTTLRFGGTAISSIGNGTLEMFGVKRGLWVSIYINFVVGSTTSFGASGNLSFDLPSGWRPAAAYTGLGTANCTDGATERYGLVAFVSSATSTCYFLMHDGTVITNSTGPGSTNDVMRVNLDFYTG